MTNYEVARDIVQKVSSSDHTLLNLIIAALNDKDEMTEPRSYEKGYEKGYEMGYENGFEQGLNISFI